MGLGVLALMNGVIRLYQSQWPALQPKSCWTSGNGKQAEIRKWSSEI